MMYTKDEVLTMIKRNNDRIDNFINSIPELIGKREEDLCMNDWFKCQSLIRKQDFYSTSKILLDILRKDGWDIKIDMQSDKLCYYGRQ